METKVIGLEKLLAKFAQIPQKVQDAARTANDQNALEFMQGVLSIIPREEGKLADTLVKEPGKTPTAVRVAIGGPGAPYPAHLEFGHRDGKGHVPAKPFWFTTLRLGRKRWRGRTSRATSKAIKDNSAGGGNGES